MSAPSDSDWTSKAVLLLHPLAPSDALRTRTERPGVHVRPRDTNNSQSASNGTDAASSCDFRDDGEEKRAAEEAESTVVMAVTLRRKYCNGGARDRHRAVRKKFIAEDRLNGNGKWKGRRLEFGNRNAAGRITSRCIEICTCNARVE